MTRPIFARGMGTSPAGPAGPAGAAGPAGPAGANGGTDASTADNVTNGTATKAALSSAYAPKAATYASGVAYVVGQLVVSGSTLYRVTTAHTSSGAIDLSKFATAGGGVPTGGTTGQTLIKNSGTDGDASWAGVPTPKFDARISAYNATPSSLRLARAAVARSAAGAATFHVAAIGDSTTLGTPGATNFSNQWHRVLTSLIGSRGAGVRGTGMLSLDVATRSGGPATTTGYESFNAGIARTGGYLQGGSGKTITLPASTDQFRVMYQKRGSSGGSVTVTVDGAGVAAIDTSSTGGTGIFFKTYDVAQGSHTLVLTAPASGNGFIMAVEARSGGANGGVKVSAFARGGRSSVSIADSSSEGDGSSIPALTALDADLVIISLGINDYQALGESAGAQTTLVDYKANMQAAITAQRAAGGDVILVGWPPQADITKTIPQASYIQQLYDLCDSNDVALLDLRARWGSFAISSPLGYYSDDVHPSDIGLADWGAAAYTLLNSVGLVL